MPDPYCLITHTWHGHIRFMDLPESALPLALKHGWTVLAKDSDVPGSEQTGLHVPAQSNPRRTSLRGEEDGA